MKGFLPDQTRISQVHLRTAGLDRALEFYQGVLGLKLSGRSDTQATLSGRANEPELLVLSEDRNAAAHVPGSIGLYHFALRYRTRNDLAQAYRGLVEAAYPITGASDHGVSEAIYLSDPDGNGLELYTDRPRSRWNWRKGYISMVTTPLDPDNLLATAPSSAVKVRSHLPPDLGHIHLHVRDLSAAERFYSDFLGLAVTQRSYPGALFFAAGDYHHHIGTNVWGANTRPPANSVGLISYRLEVPLAEILYCLSNRAPLLGYESQVQPREKRNPILQVRDPSGTLLEIQASSNAVLAGPGSQWAGCPEEPERRSISNEREAGIERKIEL